MRMMIPKNEEMIGTKKNVTDRRRETDGVHESLPTERDAQSMGSMADDLIVVPWTPEARMSRINGEKARAAIAKRNRTARRAKDRARLEELKKTAAAAKQKPQQ